MNWIGWILLACAVILLLWCISAYNKLVSLSVRVENGWAQIGVQLKKRFDLIPNLVETVKGYAAHESKTLTEVIRMRGAAMNAKTPEEVMDSNAKLSHAIVNLFATAEQYPDLKANQNFLQLQSELKDIESKIAFARQFYNDTAMRFNEYTLRFPSNLIASVFHFERKKYFEVEEAEKEAPKVQF